MSEARLAGHVPGDPSHDRSEVRIIHAMKDFNKSHKLFTRIVKGIERKAKQDQEFIYHSFYSIAGGFCRFRWNIKEQHFDALGLGRRDKSVGPYRLKINYESFPMPKHKKVNG